LVIDEDEQDVGLARLRGVQRGGEDKGEDDEGFHGEWIVDLG
jgi:hypothetical protein